MARRNEIGPQMSSRTAIATIVACLLGTAAASAGPQLDWARHGFQHGAWDCYGDCPSGRAQPVHRPHTPGRASFDGAWTVSAAGPCLSAGTSQVMISGSRIMGQNGEGGHVSPSGAVTTVGNIDGVTVVGNGQISGRSASGIYQQSDGCSGSWNAVKF